MVCQSNFKFLVLSGRWTLLLLLAAIAFANVSAQETDATDTTQTESAAVTASDDDSADSDAESEPDPFAVPKDADAGELFKFIQTVKRQRSRNIEDVQRAASAAVDAA